MKIFKNRNAGVVLVLGVLGLLCALSPGCRSTPRVKPVAWNLIITNTTAASVEVDVVGVTENEKGFYEGLSMEDYWKPGGGLRRDADKLSNLLERDSWTISRKNPKWREWLDRGVKQVLVVADLPEKNALWKVPLSLDKNAWDARHRTLEIEIQNTLVRITPMR